MYDPAHNMYEVINDTKILHKYRSFDIYTKHFSEYKLVKDGEDTTFTQKRMSDFLNKRLFIRMEDRVKLIREKQFRLGFKLKKSMKVDIKIAKRILNELIKVTMSEPKSDILDQMQDTIKVVVNQYLEQPHIVSSLTKVCVHDYSTQQHLINVMLYCMGYAYHNGLNDEEISVYGLIGLMHDIGKISVPDYLLQAKRKLTPKEYKTIKLHPKNGWEILRACDFDARVRIAAHEHHERLDGSGYPDGKTGPDLFEASKVLAIIDMFEAMTTWRPYKKPVKPYVALEAIKNDVKASKLDPVIFKRFAYSIIGMTSQ